jgi:septum formation protein
VRFARLSPEEIEWYLAGEEVLDKAGAYGIQGRAGVFVEEIRGDFFNVVGLPLRVTYRLLRKLGWPPGRA